MPLGFMASDRHVGIDFARMREYKLARVRAQMEKEGISTLITWDPYSIRYICDGYVTIPNRYACSQCVVLPINGDPHCFITSSFSSEAIRRDMPWLKGKIWNTVGSSKWVEKVEDLKNYMNKFMPIIEEHGLKDEVVGLDGCQQQVLFIDAFAEKGVKHVRDCTAMMFRARAVKNVDEVNCVKLACRIADAAFEDMRQAIRPGIKECELVGIGMNRLYACGCDETQEFVCASGPRTNPMHIDFTDRMVCPGDLVVIDVNGASYMGYKSCYYRTFCCGKATQEQKDCYKEALDMMYDAMYTIKAGSTTDDIRAVWPKSPQYWGYEDWFQVGGYALGHGLGLSLHDFPTMFFARPQPNYTFQEGEVIAVETWAGKKGGNFGVRLEEDLVVTKDGFELLTHWPVQEVTECWI